MASGARRNECLLGNVASELYRRCEASGWPAGPDHPELATTYSNLGGAYGARAR
jgi:hypothetical protein